MLVNVKSRRLLNHVKSLGRRGRLIAHAHKMLKARGGVKGKKFEHLHLSSLQYTFGKVVT